MKKYSYTGLISFLILAILFVCATYIAHTYTESLTKLIQNNTRGYLIYVILMTLATVIAPLSTLPIMPVAVSLWGSFITALLSIIGWSLGAIIAFYISRKFGLQLVKKFVAQKHLDKIESSVPQHKNLLLPIIVLRMIIPVDVLSYTLGLFPQVTWKPYIIGSIIGVIPFSFIFAYAGSLPIQFQIIGLIIILPILVIYFKLQHKSNTTS